MAVSARVEPLERDVELLINSSLSRKAQSAMLAEVAREELRLAQEINRQATGSVPKHETFVDGHAEVPLETVRPDGTIIFEFTLLLDLFAWIGAELVQHSPIGDPPIHYFQNHLFFADGLQVAPGEKVPEATTYAFVNAVPYARKIERGLSPQAPEGVYEVVAVLAQRQFGNIARVRFTFRDLVGHGRQPAIEITQGR